MTACRDYLNDPIPNDVLRRVLNGARSAPRAGNTSALDLLVIDEPARYWDITLPAGPGRDGFPWPGLLRAPILVIPVVDPAAYVARYSEPDKAATGLGEGIERWTVPYWWVDGGAATMSMIAVATHEGLGSLLFGQFDHEPALMGAFGVPDGRRAVGTVALGWPGPDASRWSASASRPRLALDAILHLNGW